MVIGKMAWNLFWVVKFPGTALFFWWPGGTASIVYAVEVEASTHVEKQARNTNARAHEP